MVIKLFFIVNTLKKFQDFLEKLSTASLILIQVLRSFLSVSNYYACVYTLFTPCPVILLLLGQYIVFHVILEFESSMASPLLM